MECCKARLGWYTTAGRLEASEGKPMPQPPFDWQEILIIAGVALAIAVAVFLFLFVGPRKPKE